MKKKVLLTVMALTYALTCALPLAACGKNSGGENPPPYTQEENPPAHTHKYTDTVVTPTCITGGYTLHECECGESYRDAETDPLGHAFTVYEHDGEQHWKVCERCSIDEAESLDEHVMRPQGQGVKCETCGLDVQESVGLSFTLNNDQTGYIVSAGNFSSPILVIPETYNGKPVVEIASEAFSTTRAWIRNIVLPSSLTKIGKKAWRNFRANRVFFRGTVEQWCNISFDEILSNPVYFSLSGELWINGELLTELNVPAGVTEIKDYAFAGCALLQNVSLSDSVAKVGKQAFYSCGVKTVRLPDDLNDISNDAFADCHIETIVSDGGRYAVKGNCWVDTKTETLLYGNADSDIPADGSVTKIAANAFNGISVKKIVIPDCVTEIGKGAFANCSALTEVTLGEGVKVIPQSAFANCEALHKIVIPDTVLTIEENAFADCTGLISVTIGRGVTQIKGKENLLGGGTSAFLDCVQLFEVYNLSPSLKVKKGDKGNGGVARYAQEIYTDASAKSKYVVTDDGFAFYNGSDKVCFVGYEGTNPSITLPATYDGKQYSVGTSAFKNNTVIENVVFPDGILSIGATTFYGATSLRTVKMGSGPEQLRWSNFYRCTSLESVTLPNTLKELNYSPFEECVSLKEIEIPDGVTVIGNSTFEGCTLLSSVKLPNSLSEIGYEAFSGCVSLEKVVIPDSLSEIPSRAFYKCASLVSVDLKNVQYIGSHAFYSCKKLETVGLGSAEEIYTSAFSECTALRFIDLSSVQTIEEQAFYKCTSLEKVDFGSSLQTIDAYAFQYCSALKEVKLPDTARTLAKQAFSYCSALEKAELGNGLEEIGEQAFYKCTSLEKVDFGSSLQTIDAYAFQYCSALKEVKLPDTARTLAKQAFCYCSALEKVELGNGLEEIETFAFYGTKIPYIIIPESVTTIGAYAFTVKDGEGCADIYCEADSAPEGWAQGWNLKKGEEEAAVHFGGTWELVNGIPTVKN